MSTPTLSWSVPPAIRCAQRDPTLRHPSRRSGPSILRSLLASIVLLAQPLAAQETTGTGTITGRVQNVATGAYLNNAQVSVIGTSIVDYTDQSGTYLLSGIPAGEVRLRVFMTGLDEQSAALTITAGATATQDFKLTSKALYGDGEEAVILSEYVVASSKETNASAIAVNEQRVASNIISVVSTDEFGTMVDKNPGEFLKWLPGVDVEYFANNITGVSVRGLGSVNTELSFDGMPVASMNAESVGRSFEVQYASAADIARVEIRKLPLPEDSANSLGGSINLVRRSAFEYSKRQVGYQVLFQADGEDLSFDDIDGPKDKMRSRWRPNWEFKWTEPLSKNFGFAITIGQNDTIANTHWSLPGWDLGSTANNTAAEAAIAAGLPYNLASIYTPGMRNPLNHNAPLMQGKTYGNLRLDWRPIPELTVSYSLSLSEGEKQVADDIRYRWDNSAVGSGERERFVDETTSLGRLGGAGIFHDNPLWRDISAPTMSNVVDLKWRKDTWEAGIAGVVSESRYDYKDTEHGFFNSTSVGNVTGLINIPHTGIGAGTANPVSVTLNYYDTGYWGPGRIEALTTATGASSTDPNAYNVPVEWWRNDRIRIGGARARPGESKEIVTGANLFVSRQLRFENPVTLKAGFDYTETYRNRHYDYKTWRFVGADGVANSPDDSASLIAADHLTARPDAAYGYPGAERISMTKLYDLYVEHPDWFRYDEARSTQLSLSSNPAYDLNEMTVAPYLQFETTLMKNRLHLAGGVRYEKTTASAHGLRIDNSAAYLKYDDGTVVHAGDVDAAGRVLVTNRGTSTNVNYVLNYGPSVLPATRTGAPVFNSFIQAAGNQARAAGQTTDTGTNLGRGTLAHTTTVYTAKGAYADSEVDNYFPSLHATYNFTDELVLQVGYAKTQAKNRFDRSVIPNNEIVENSASATGALGRIRVRNPDLQPWIGDNYEARLSYYTPTGGVAGIGYFHKKISQYQLELISEPLTEEEATELGELYPDLGIGPEHAGYELQTWVNVGDAQIDGIEVEFRQSLDLFLPDWARGFLVRGSLAFTNLNGQPAGGDFNNLRDNRYTLNVGYRNQRFSANVGYIMNGLVTNNGAITSNGRTGIQQTVPQHMVDFNCEYTVAKYLKLFVAGNNIFDERRAREDRYVERPTAKEMGSSNTFGITFTAGISGSF